MRKFIHRFRQSPVFSTVYILGSALSVASLMLVAIFIHVKVSDIYPEYDRQKIRYIEFVNVTNSLWGTTNGTLAYPVTQELRELLEPYGDVAVRAENVPDKLMADGKWFDHLTVLQTDAGWFKVYDYEFVDGRPFTAQESDSHQRKIVLSDRLARRMFGSDKGVVGRQVMVSAGPDQYGFHMMGSSGSISIGGGTVTGASRDDTDTYTVTGVYRESSRLLPLTFAQAVMVMPEYVDRSAELLSKVRVDINGTDMRPVVIGISHLVGDYMLRVRPRSAEDAARIESLLDEYATRKSADAHDGYDLSVDFGKGSQSAFEQEMIPQIHGDHEEDLRQAIASVGLLVLFLLLIPALNLSSLLSGNMDSRIGENGVRKAFGATRSHLLMAGISENMWLTGCGAVLGMLLAWWGVVAWKDWLFAGPNGEITMDYSDVLVDPAMLFAPAVFVAAVLICFMLNLLSSLLPIWWSLRRPIVESLHSKL